MKLSQGEKLILLMLCDIYERANIQNSIDVNPIRQAISTGNTWAIPDIPDGIENESVKDKVFAILEMWRALESSYKSLDDAQKMNVNQQIAPFKVEFAGFDGNAECVYMNVANFIIQDLNRYNEFRKRDLNSHCRTIDTYTRMLNVYETVKVESSNFHQLTEEDIISIMRIK